MKKKPLLLIVAGAISVMTLWTAAFFLQIGTPTPSSQWIADVYRAKEEALKKSTPPRIILIGGSGTLFGFDSDRIREDTGITTINFGTHAGLGLDYLLYRAKRVLRPGDIAVVVPEYAHFSYTGPKEETQIDFIVSRDPDYFFEKPWTEKIRYISAMPLMRLMKGVFHKFRKNSSAPKGLYGAHNINKWGDQINIREEQRTESDLLRLSTAKPAVIGTITPESKKIFNDFASFAKSLNVRLYMAPPAILDHQNYHSKKAEDFFSDIRKTAKETGYIYLGRAEDFIMPKNMFFNTIYHLNRSGIEERTARFIALLKPHLERN